MNGDQLGERVREALAPKHPTQSRAGGAAQVAGRLPGKGEALGSNPGVCVTPVPSLSVEIPAPVMAGASPAWRGGSS